jgi:hypothetical protein
MSRSPAEAVMPSQDSVALDSIRPAAASGPVTLIMRRWRQGEPPDARAAQATHPELSHEEVRDLVFD